MADVARRVQQGAASDGPLAAPPTTSLIVVLALLTTIAPLATDAYLPAFPRMSDDLGASASSIQLTLTTFMIGLALGQLVIGSLSDRFGRRRPLLIGSAVCAISSGLCAVAPSIGFLSGMRLVQGFSGAAGIVLGRAVISDRARGAAAARAFGVLMVIGGVGPVLAPLIGGGVIAIAGWRAVFWALALLSAAMFAGVVAGVRESLAPEHRHSGGLRTMLTLARDVLADRRYLGYALGFCLGFCTLFAYIAASPFVIQQVLGLRSGLYALDFAVNSSGLVLVNALNTRLLRRHTPRRLLLAGLTVQVGFTTLLLAVVCAGVTAPVPVLVLLFGAVSCFGFLLANATALALSAVPHAAGTGSAIIGSLQFGLAALVAPLVGLAGEDTAVPMAIAMLAFCAAALACVLVVARR
jgi:DHA1 family bicyclomycin/chloramphenicol resistance-like MFS transporter